MNANRYVLRPATFGPCRASPVHRSFGLRGLEPAERLGRGAVGAGVEPEAGEEALHGALRRAVALGRRG